MSIARVILFGMIPTTIPSTTPTVDLPIIHDDTPLIPTDTLTISPVVPTIPPIAPTIQYTSSFIYNESSDNDTPNSPPSQDPYEVTIAWWRSRVTARSSPPSSLIRQILPAPPRLPRRPAILLFLGVDVEDSYEPYTDPDVDTDVQEYIDKCIAYANAIRDRGMDDRDVVETTAADEVKSSARGTIEVEVDPRIISVINYDVRKSIIEDVPDHVTVDGAVKVTYETLGDLGHRITGVDLEVTTLTERISALERDNMRLRGMLDVESQRVDRLQRSLTMLTATRTGMTQDVINELIAKRADEALKAYDAARNPKTEAEIENEQQDNHVEGDVINGNGNGNGNGNSNVNNRGVVPVARECTYYDFVKCQQLNFKGTEGFVGLTR
ncbi:hypothetical protein Tco_0442884 [Tanacetum coccineum]